MTETMPDPDSIRAVCPLCAGVVVSTLSFTEGKGYLIVWQCEEKTCRFRIIL